MRIPTALLTGLLLGAAPDASAQGPARGLACASLGTFGPPEFETFLQRFVDEQYLKSFRLLGEEDDFDHAHLLFGPGSAERPLAILYHTQELSTDGSLDPAARNWLQWTGRSAIEDAALYARREYPRTPSWDWFLHKDLPALRARHTILDKMLDPALLGAELSESRQWVFTRVDCGPAAPAVGSNLLRIALPKGPRLCLSLARS